MNLSYLLLLGLCIVCAIAQQTHEVDSDQKKLQNNDQDTALVADSSVSDVSSLEEDALADPLPDDAKIPKESPKWGKNRKSKGRKWRKWKCKHQNKTEGAAEDGETNNEPSEVKCERYRHRGYRRRGNKDKKDSDENDQNENTLDKHHHHHHHHHCKGNRTESDDAVQGQNRHHGRHHHKWRKNYKHQNEQSEDEDDNQIENEERKRGRHRHRGHQHRGNTNENGESVHDSEWHKHHNFPKPEGYVDQHGHHHHHHHHHHCHNRTTTTTSGPTPPPSTTAEPVNDNSVTDFDVRVDAE